MIPKKLAKERQDYDDSTGEDVLTAEQLQQASERRTACLRQRSNWQLLPYWELMADTAKYSQLRNNITKSYKTGYWEVFFTWKPYARGLVDLATGDLVVRGGSGLRAMTDLEILQIRQDLLEVEALLARFLRVVQTETVHVPWTQAELDAYRQRMFDEYGVYPDAPYRRQLPTFDR